MCKNEFIKDVKNLVLAERLFKYEEACKLPFFEAGLKDINQKVMSDFESFTIETLLGNIGSLSSQNTAFIDLVFYNSFIHELTYSEYDGYDEILVETSLYRKILADIKLGKYDIAIFRNSIKNECLVSTLFEYVCEKIQNLKGIRDYELLLFYTEFLEKSIEHRCDGEHEMKRSLYARLLEISYLDSLFANIKDVYNYLNIIFYLDDEEFHEIRYKKIAELIKLYNYDDAIFREIKGQISSLNVTVVTAQLLLQDMQNDNTLDDHKANMLKELKYVINEKIKLDDELPF